MCAEPYNKLYTPTIGKNARKSIFTTEKPYWRPFSYPPEHHSPFIRTYIRSSCYVEDFYVEAPAWKHLCEGFRAEQVNSLSLSLSLSLSWPSSTVLLRSLTYTFCVLLTYTYLRRRFSFSCSPAPLHIRPYIYVLTSTYLRRGSLDEKIFAKFFRKRSTKGFLENFWKIFSPFSYVEYIT